MPQQKTSDELKETGVIGLGVGLIILAVETAGQDPFVGALGVLVGLMMIFFGVRYRNLSTDLKPDEVMDGIEVAEREFSESVEDIFDGGAEETDSTEKGG